MYICAYATLRQQIGKFVGFPKAIEWAQHDANKVKYIIPWPEMHPPKTHVLFGNSVGTAANKFRCT